ncbi:tryptophan halogenase family protein [Catenovulum sediminis]|uniref:Tryptophan halogenase family protein n=1 Tax=Catenovulum sediminis TaxID=1740262 RepID=A0ABV1RII0_9ALTE
MNPTTNSVLIIGGGSAGWITAAVLASQVKQQFEKPINITLIESPDVATIGVGEGTWPTMRKTLKSIGISETEFIKECDVSFKQGAKFAKWHTGEDDDFYFHPLMLPQGDGDFDLTPFWQVYKNASDCTPSFSNAVCSQEAICQAGLAPKTITTAEYDSIANYAYHLDAGKFAKLLKKHCIEKLGVVYTQDHITDVNADQEDFIHSVTTKNLGAIKADFFIDCSGFSSLIIDKHYQIPFNNCQHVLFADSAIATQVPYPDPMSPIASHTISTAQANGWIWDIGLPTRRGVGYVYSSHYQTDDQALEVLKSNLTLDETSQLNFKKIKFTPGHREKFWHKNAVAIGMAAGFLEPLEASALVLIEISAQMIAEQFPVNRQSMLGLANQYNQTSLYRWQRIIDFLKLHYVLSNRPEKFWQDNRNPESIPKSLSALLDLWQHMPPHDQQFPHAVEVFPAASYRYVLFGMGFQTRLTDHGLNLTAKTHADEHFQNNQIATDQLIQSLPNNRVLLQQIYQYGLQKI